MGSVGIYLNYSESTLTFSWALYIIFVAGVIGIIIGALGWWFITAAMLKRRHQREAPNQRIGHGMNDKKNGIRS
jgi:succinate-acetate transporter protein